MTSLDYSGPMPERRLGFEAFVENQVGMSGGRVIGGRKRIGSKAGARFKEGPMKGMTLGQGYERARSQYGRMNDQGRRMYEGRAAMNDVRSSRERAGGGGLSTGGLSTGSTYAGPRVQQGAQRPAPQPAQQVQRNPVQAHPAVQTQQRPAVDGRETAAQMEARTSQSTVAAMGGTPVAQSQPETPATRRPGLINGLLAGAVNRDLKKFNDARDGVAQTVVKPGEAKPEGETQVGVDNGNAVYAGPVAKPNATDQLGTSRRAAEVDRGMRLLRSA